MSAYSLLCGPQPRLDSGTVLRNRKAQSAPRARSVAKFSRENKDFRWLPPPGKSCSHLAGSRRLETCVVNSHDECDDIASVLSRHREQQSTDFGIPASVGNADRREQRL